MKISVILNTCNRARSLELCLLALMRQTYRDFEVIVADDGSTDHTPDVVKRFAESAPFSIRHVWQEKDGHGRVKILNEGIKAASYDYIFFTDCDVLALPNTLEVHARYSSPRHFLLGGMINMSGEYSASITPEDVRRGKFEELLSPEKMEWLRRRNRKARIQVFLRRRRKPHINATNLSMAKEALLKVNGFDENFRAWGNADGDLRERLKKVGIYPKAIYDEAIVFHIYHDRDPTAPLRLNRAYSKRRNIPARCLNGIEKLGEKEEAR